MHPMRPGTRKRPDSPDTDDGRLPPETFDDLLQRRKPAEDDDLIEQEN